MTRSLLLATACALLASVLPAQEGQFAIHTEKGDRYSPAVSHPLAWWTEDPLRLDVSGDLMLGFKAPDGRTLTSKDYMAKAQVIPIGELAGHKIVQLMTTIRPGPRVIAAGFAQSSDDISIWKDLLVSSADRRGYVEIYALRYDGTGLVKQTTASVYGSDADAILGTYDADTGNGGGCFDGYWWFSGTGAHEVDFAPLIKAILHAIPSNTGFTSRCWALDPKNHRLISDVQRSDAECHACGILGEVQASYRIEQGVARPVSVVFRPGTPH